MLIKGFTLKNVLYIALMMTCFGMLNGLSFRVTDVLKSATDLTTGTIQGAVQSIPSIKDIFTTSKQLIAGYPFEVAATAINKVCSAALASKSVSPLFTPDVDKLQFQLRIGCKRVSVPLTQAQQLWNVSEFDSNKKVVILVTGWTTSVNKSLTVDEFATAYACRDDVNFLALDAAYYVDTLYTWSAFNTEVLGKEMAKGLAELIHIVPLENIHLIGHSLGAHIVGATGRYFQQYTNLNLPRITGLDPAKPCFNEGETLTGLMRGDADYVDVIHTNPGVLGIREPIGDIDFYPGGLGPLPDGCYSVTCAHERAWEYFVETVYPGNEEKYIGTRCRSLNRLREGDCNQIMATMGYGLIPNRKGNFFLEVPGDLTYNSNTDKQCKTTPPDCSLK